VDSLELGEIETERHGGGSDRGRGDAHAPKARGVVFSTGVADHTLGTSRGPL